MVLCWNSSVDVSATAAHEYSPTRSCAELTSIAEVTAMMEALDEDDAMFLEVEGCAPEPILGDGDLLDDFVESAQQAELVEDDRYGPEVLAEAGTIAWDLDDANASEASGDEQGVPRRYVACELCTFCHL